MHRSRRERHPNSRGRTMIPLLCEYSCVRAHACGCVMQTRLVTRFRPIHTHGSIIVRLACTIKTYTRVNSITTYYNIHAQPSPSMRYFCWEDAWSHISPIAGPPFVQSGVEHSPNIPCQTERRRDGPEATYPTVTPDHKHYDRADLLPATRLSRSI